MPFKLKIQKSFNEEYEKSMKIEDIVGDGHKRLYVRGPRKPRVHGKELFRKPVKESGHMAGVGSIHIDEIAATLSALENHLDIELQSNVLGSVGKKEFSGDIDVAVQMSSDQVESFMQNLLEIDIVEDVDRAPNLVMAKVKIIGYDSSKDGYNRTGFVQVDFMLNDDIEWLKTFYHSPAQNESKYKGAHRNIAVGSYFTSVSFPLGRVLL